MEELGVDSLSYTAWNHLPKAYDAYSGVGPDTSTDKILI